MTAAVRFFMSLIRYDRGTAVVAGNLLACLAALPFALPVPSAELSDWAVIVYLGLFQIGFAYILVTTGMRRVSALESSLLVLVEPVLNPVWVWLFLGERPGWLALLGGLIIIASVAARTLQQRRIVAGR